MPGTDISIVLEDRRLDLRVERDSGSLHHFYHFIVDLAWPIHHWLREEGISPAEMLRIESGDPNVGHFAAHGEFMLGVPLQATGRSAGLRSRFRKRPTLRGFTAYDRFYLQALGSRAAMLASARRFRDDIASRLGIEPPTGNDRAVILIEREKDGDNRGAMRRDIGNQLELRQALSELCQHQSVTLRIVQLAQLRFAEQFALFHRPCVIVGQHGAGLIHMLWTPGSGCSLLELARLGGNPLFGHLAEDLGLAYERIDHLATAHADSMERIQADSRRVTDWVLGRLLPVETAGSGA